MGSSHKGTWSPGLVAGTSPLVCADLAVRFPVFISFFFYFSEWFEFWCLFLLRFVFGNFNRFSARSRYEFLIDICYGFAVSKGLNATNMLIEFKMTVFSLG